MPVCSNVQRYAFLVELRKEEQHFVVHCRGCESDIVQVEGIFGLGDLDKASTVVIIDSISEVCKSSPYRS